MNCIRPTTHTWIERFTVLWMRRTVVVSFFALMLLAPSQGSAQALQSFEDLALRVNLDDQLQVEDQSGVKATGRLTRLTRDEVASGRSIPHQRCEPSMHAFACSDLQVRPVGGTAF